MEVFLSAEKGVWFHKRRKFSAQLRNCELLNKGVGFHKIKFSDQLKMVLGSRREGSFLIS